MNFWCLCIHRATTKNLSTVDWGDSEETNEVKKEQRDRERHHSTHIMCVLFGVRMLMSYGCFCLGSFFSWVMRIYIFGSVLGNSFGLSDNRNDRAGHMWPDCCHSVFPFCERKKKLCHSRMYFTQPAAMRMICTPNVSLMSSQALFGGIILWI